MAEYYLISQLPSLDGIGDNTPLPISQKRFDELCESFLSDQTKELLAKLTLSPPQIPEESGSALIDSWNESERNLRFALAKVRADKMHKHFDTENKPILADNIKAAAMAADADDPMESEKFLNRFRLEVLELLRPTDPFSDDFVLYYGLKLKLLLRIRQFDTKTGEKEYRNFYNSILYGDRLEAKQ